jgi:hypothetical protein
VADDEGEEVSAEDDASLLEKVEENGVEDATPEDESAADDEGRELERTEDE